MQAQLSVNNMDLSDYRVSWVLSYAIRKSKLEQSINLDPGQQMEQISTAEQAPSQHPSQATYQADPPPQAQSSP